FRPGPPREHQLPAGVARHLRQPPPPRAGAPAIDQRAGHRLGLRGRQHAVVDQPAQRLPVGGRQVGAAPRTIGAWPAGMALVVPAGRALVVVTWSAAGPRVVIVALLVAVARVATRIAALPDRKGVV